MQATCIYCNASFEATRPTAKFCSGAHRVKYYREGGAAVESDEHEPDCPIDFEDIPIVRMIEEPVVTPVVIKSVPPHLTEAKLAQEVVVFPSGMSDTALKERMVRIKEYNETQVKQRQPQHLVRRENIEAKLARSGYDYKLARFAFD